MNYTIHITKTAERDITNAADYIEFTLKNPQAADHMLDEADDKINALSQFPRKFCLVEDRLLASWGIRFTVVNNYLAFYIILEDKHLVIVVRFLYSKSNWSSILKLGFPLR